MTLGLNREGTKQKYTYQKRFTNRSWNIEVDCSARILWSNSLTVVAVNCDNRKVMGKEKWHRMRFEKSTKDDNIEFKKKKMVKSILKSIKN